MQDKGSLVILGEGPLRPKLEALADELGVADRIAMPGFLTNPQQVLQFCDLYVWLSFQKVCEGDLIARKPAL